MDKKRRELIEESLHKDLFKMADDIVVEEDPNDFSSTEKLSNILDGYISKVENTQFDEENEDFEILDSKNLDIEVDEKDIIRAYSHHIHEFNEDTFSELLNSQDTKTIDNLEVELVENLDMLDDENFDSETENTQTIVSPIKIDKIDDIKFEDNESDDEESKFEVLDFVLIFAVIVLVIVLFYIFMKG